MLLCVFVSSQHCFIAGGGGERTCCSVYLSHHTIVLLQDRRWGRKDMLLCVFVSSHHCFFAGGGGERTCCSVYLSHHSIVLLQEVGAKGHVALCIWLITLLSNNYRSTLPVIIYEASATNRPLIAGGGGERTCCSVYLSHHTNVLLQEVGAKGHVALCICLITPLFYCRRWGRGDMLFCVFVSSHNCFIAGGGGEGTCCSVYLSHDTLVLLQEVGARGHVALYICLITPLFYCRNWKRKDMLLCVFVSSHHCFIAGGGGKGHVALCICLITPLFYCRNWRRKDVLLCVFLSSHHCFIAGIGGERICCSVYLSHHSIVLLQEVGAKGHAALCICLITALFYCRRWGRKDMLLCVFGSSHSCRITIEVHYLLLYMKLATPIALYWQTQKLNPLIFPSRR